MRLVLCVLFKIIALSNTGTIQLAAQGTGRHGHMSWHWGLPNAHGGFRCLSHADINSDVCMLVFAAWCSPDSEFTSVHLPLFTGIPQCTPAFPGILSALSFPCGISGAASYC